MVKPSATSPFSYNSFRSPTTDLKETEQAPEERLTEPEFRECSDDKAGKMKPKIQKQRAWM